MAKAKKKIAARARGQRTEQLSFRLPHSVVQQLGQVAKAAGVDRSMVIRVVLGFAIVHGRGVLFGDK